MRSDQIVDYIQKFNDLCQEMGIRKNNSIPTNIKGTWNNWSSLMFYANAEIVSAHHQGTTASYVGASKKQARLEEFVRELTVAMAKLGFAGEYDWEAYH